MHLTIDGQPRELQDLRQFRAAHKLPETFGVAQFEPKDFSGLASIDHAGADLNRVRERVLQAIPAALTMPELLPFTDTLTALFRTQLIAINPRVNLKDTEIDFAVAGFGDLHRALAYALVRARAGGAMPTFSDVYQQWLDESTRISSKVHDYIYDAQHWQIRIINTAYGRAGLIVNAGENVHYLRDDTLACPAEGYMFVLMKETSRRIIMAVDIS